jgi:Papain-like cysteine protease AvrRpt2
MSSSIDTTRQPLNRRAEGALPSAGAQPSTIRFEMQRQCHSNWCWAAVAASVAAFYRRDGKIKQCDIANLELNRSDCCDHPCDANDVDFNVTNVFASPLNRVRCFERLARQRRATPTEVQEELAAARPLCVRTVWRDGGAHFLAIVGFRPDAVDEEQGVLSLDDPFWGPSEYTYARFSENYQLAGGKWTDTYFTKSPSRRAAQVRASAQSGRGQPIRPAKVPTDAVEIVRQTLSKRASASGFGLPMLSKADPEALSIAMPHKVEFLDLADIRGDRIPKQRRPECWRFLVLEERPSGSAEGGGDQATGFHPIAAATAVRAEGGGFEFDGLNEGPFVRATQEAIRRAETLTANDGGPFEVALLVVPALCVVALWLQDLSSEAGDYSGAGDRLIPIEPSQLVRDAVEPLDPALFLEALRRIDAQRVDPDVPAQMTVGSPVSAPSRGAATGGPRRSRRSRKGSRGAGSGCRPWRAPRQARSGRPTAR